MAHESVLLVCGRAYGDGIAMHTRSGINTVKVVSGAFGAKDQYPFTGRAFALELE